MLLDGWIERLWGLLMRIMKRKAEFRPHKAPNIKYKMVDDVLTDEGHTLRTNESTNHMVVLLA